MERLRSGWVVLALLVAALAMLGLFEAGNRTVYPHGEGVSGMPTVFELQLSSSEEGFREVLDLWSGEPCASDITVSARCHLVGDVEVYPDGIAALKRTTIRLDFLFPLVYSAFFVAALAWLWRPGGRVLRWLVVLGVVTAAADWMENLLHLWVLRGVDSYADVAAADLSGAAITAASLFAAVKFALILGAVGGLLAGVVVRISRRRRAADRRS
jgi:hypothetical protein